MKNELKDDLNNQFQFSPIVFGPDAKSPTDLIKEYDRRVLSNKMGGRLYRTYFRG